MNPMLFPMGHKISKVGERDLYRKNEMKNLCYE